MRFNVYLNRKQNENNVGEILVITLIKKIRKSTNMTRLSMQDSKLFSGYTVLNNGSSTTVSLIDMV